MKRRCNGERYHQGDETMHVVNKFTAVHARYVLVFWNDRSIMLGGCGCFDRLWVLMGFMHAVLEGVNGASRKAGFRRFEVGAPSKRRRVTEGDEGMVAADDERCSQIGRDALLVGGSAVDAAVATALCLGVVNPVASGIGGGGFLLLRLANGTAIAYDMRETAPAAAREVRSAPFPSRIVHNALLPSLFFSSSSKY
jgi:hypothetical protein